MSNPVIKRVISNPDQVGRQQKISKTSMHGPNGEGEPSIYFADRRETVATEDDVAARIRIEKGEESGIQNHDITKDQLINHNDNYFIEDTNEILNGDILNEKSHDSLKEIPRQVSVDSTKVHRTQKDDEFASRIVADAEYPAQMKIVRTGQNSNDPGMDYEEIRYRSRKSSSSSDRGSSSQLAKDWGWFEDVHSSEVDGKGEDPSRKNVTRHDDIRKSMIKEIEDATTDGKKKKLKLFFDNMTVNDVDEVVPKKGEFSRMVVQCCIATITN